MDATHSSWRRWFGLFFLFTAGGMVVWGMTLLAPFLESHRVFFVLYWLACFVVTFLAMLIALIDGWLVRREARLARRELLRSAMEGALPKEQGREKRTQ